MKTQHKQWALFSAAVTLLASSVALAGIASTKHNLSTTGPGTYKATTETQLCVYCHAPHNTNPSAPLWNHTLSAATYTPYASNTLAGSPGQPTGSSKLCLTCHDGTVALGSVTNLPGQHFAPGTITGLSATLLGTSAEIGTDLRNDHPVSFAYDAALVSKNPEIKSPATLTGKFRPESGELQCSNCHDPHSSANPKFMLTGYVDGSGYGSPLCLTCHEKQYWLSSPNAGHRDSNATWDGTGTNPWHIPGQNLPNSATSTPKINGCESCHQPHGGNPSDHMLKKPGATQSSLCLVCHNGSVSSPEIKAQGINILTSLNKVSHHPANDPAYAGKHSIRRQADGKVREDQANFNNQNRHSECTDCHNPHGASPGRSPDTSTTANLTNAFAPPTLNGVWGVEPTNYRGGGLPAWTIADQYSGYTIIDNVEYTYQVCFKCHSSYAWGTLPADDPSGFVAGGYMSDVAKEFNPNNKSFHPAAGTEGKNDFIMTKSGRTYDYSRSLLIGGTAAAQTIQVSCLECHSNRDPISGELGPKGVHGSNVQPILWAPYDKNTGMLGTETHLCFKCHDYTVYTGGSGGRSGSAGYYTGFSNGSTSLHRYHVGKEDIPCTGCHSAVPHGMYNRHLLIYGMGNKTPTPYNNHSQVGRRTNWGINSNTNFDVVESGNYTKSKCHSYNMGGAC